MMILKQRRSIRIKEMCKEDHARIVRISHKSYRNSHHGRLYRRIHRQAIDEDITEDEIVNAIKQGFTRPVDIKNYLRTGMGPCQGRGCESQIMRLIRQVTGQRPESILSISNRPPITPIPIGVLKEIKKQEVIRR